MRRCLLLMILVGVGLLILAAGFPGARAMFAASSEQPQPAAAMDNAVPLPGGCGHVTPPGEPERVCCISGYVYLDGKPIAGAKISIETDRGKTTAVYTEKYADGNVLPYYRLDLTALPLGVQPGDTILIRAEYGDYKQDLTYVVRSHGQQVDIVLPKSQTGNYQFDHLLEPTPPDPLLFNQPNGVATDSIGNVYVLDKENARVVVFDVEGNFLRQWGRFGSGPGQFRHPTTIALNSSQNYLYVADSAYAFSSRIQKFSLTGASLGLIELASSSVVTATPYVNVNAMFIDMNEDIFLVDNGQVWQFDAKGKALNRWGTYGNGDGQFYNASGLASDSAGNLYVVDSGNYRVQKFTKTGVFLGKWGSRGMGDGQFSTPKGIALDSANNVYVVDSGNHRLQKFGSDGTFITKWGSQGDGLFRFNSPTTIAINNDRLYITDTGNHRIQKFTLDGQWKQHWGSYGSIACIFNPFDVAINHQGNLLVLNGYDYDQRAACLTRLQSDGQEITPWPLPEWGDAVTVDANDNSYIVNGTYDYLTNTWFYRLYKFNNTGGHVLTAEILNQIRYPTAIAVDGNGSVYVSGTISGTNQYQIDKLDSNGTWQAAWTHYGTTNLAFNYINGLAIDKMNNLYVAQYTQVLKLASNGSLVSTIANPELSSIQSLALDASDNLFAIDTGGVFRIQKLAPNGQLLSAWRVPDTGNGYIRIPTKILADNTDQVYVIEKGSANHRDDAILKVYRPMTFTLPIATINYRSHIASILQSETLELRGMGQDSDSDGKPSIVAYQWASDRNGGLGTAATLQIPASQLALGEHKITFTVQDNEGEWSAPVSLQLFVTDGAIPTPTGTTTPQPTLTPTPTPPAQTTWTMLLYLDGDYNDGSQLFRRFNDMLGQLQQRSLPANVNIAIQVDGPQTGDARRLVLKHDAQGNTITETSAVNSTNEAAMDNPATLTDFVGWGQGVFTNTLYYLAIADHGQAVRGIAWDSTSDISDNGAADFSAYLTVKEVGEALRKPELKPLDLLHLDACSMNLLETAYELKDVADILISSQYLAWDYFNYPAYVAGIQAGTGPLDLATLIVNTYADTVERDHHPYTISALNLRRVEAADLALSALVTELQQSGQPTTTTFAAIRDASQTFESDGDYLNSPNDLYVDLTDWLQRLRKQVTAGAVATRIEELQTVLTGADRLILNNRRQTNALPTYDSAGQMVNLGDANGLSIFYPRDKSSQALKQYTDDELFSFTITSEWPNFLLGHTVLPPGVPITPPPAPSTMLESGGRIFLPIVLR